MQQDVQALVDEWIERNKTGDCFTHHVPDDWPIEAWRLLLDATCEQWDTESLHVFIAGHIHAPEEIVRVLAASPRLRVVWSIAEKRNLPRDLFAVLAQHEDEVVRQQIARNKKTPQEVVESLRDDPAESVRQLVQLRLTFSAKK